MMRKRFAVFGVLALVLALLMPSRAFGWDFVGDGTWWRGNTSEGMYGACVHAGNKYDAAAWLFSPGDPAMLSSEIRTKLSDPNYGGRFYEYAQTFSLMEDLTQYPEWLPAYVGVANIFVNGLAGDVNFYTSNVSDSLYAGAKIDFQRVLAGEDLSGGGGSGGSGPDVSGGLDMPFSWGSDNVIFSKKMNNKDAFRSANGSATLRLTSSQASDVCSYQYVVIGLSLVSPGVYGTPSNATFVFSVFGTNNPSPTVTQNSSDMAKVQAAGGTCFAYGTNNAAVTLSAYNGGVFTPTYQSSNTYLTGWMLYYSVIPVGDLSPEPDGDWPEPESPVTPDPPEVPIPTAPVGTVEPSVSGPSVVWPDITINVEPTPEGLDYTELLTAINNNLNSLRSDLNQEFDSVISSLRNIYQYLQHLDSMLERHCKHIRDSIEDNVYELELWLKSLFEWLPEQLDYDADLNFDDSELRYLLRRILNKIPGGSNTAPTTYKPNPQADEPGFFDWLLDLWHRFLIDLVSVLPDELGGLVDAFSQLTHYFPFSIPWDLFALLLLFEHEPVTPVFQIPWGYGGGDGQTQMITIDLSAWDGVMAMVRPVFLVGFCFKLALITKDLLAGFDLSKGGV